MKLSKETVNLLKNYAGINTNILLKEGSKLSTIASQKNVMADANVSEVFPQNFGIYDLNEFLGVLSLFEEPELEFDSGFVNISEGDNKIKFYAAEESILTVPTKAINFPEADVEFELSSSMLNMIQRTASVLRVSDFQISGDGKKITLSVGDKKNATGNRYVTHLGNTDKLFKVNLKVENLKMLPGNYTVSVSSKKISRFKSGDDLVYYVAVEADSTFE
jgi:hypothetical protein